MTRTDDLRKVLDTFASELEAAGFRVYRPGENWTFIGFGRQVDGRWCVGSVSASDFGNSGGWSWHMSIVPSRENGSSMWLPDVPDGTPLTVETAEHVAVPAAWNPVVGRQVNVGSWPAHWGQG